MTSRRTGLLSIGFAGLAIAGAFGPVALHAEQGVYETNLDPGVGFNLISWWDGTQGSHWRSAIDQMYDAGFREVSLSPLRFADVRTGNVLTDAQSSRGSPLASLESGLQRAKQLGMRVTLNPFIELYDSQDGSYFADAPGTGGCTWRGCWNPSGSVRSTFFDQYEGYIEDVASLADQYGADSMTVGTEMRQIVGNPANNADWGSVINAADAIYDGPIGYSANWDHFAFGGPGNVTQAIFDHPAIDFVGVDSYFTNLVSGSAADNSGAYPNQSFIDEVEAAWNSLLDNNLLPYAAARNNGEGLPLVFTEFGHLPRNRTSLDPQQQASGSQPLDTAEQRMAFEGFFNAIDGRQDVIPAVHIWQWGMAGSGGSLWNINTSSPDQPNNNDLADWLVDFVSTATIGGPQAVGDFNADGSVDAADYTVWRDASGGSLSSADANGDGTVDSLDYAVWRDNYGASATAVSSSVPEPSTLWLAAAFAAASGCLIGRRR